jgi:hypothetical protein
MIAKDYLEEVVVNFMRHEESIAGNRRFYQMSRGFPKMSDMRLATAL